MNPIICAIDTPDIILATKLVKLLKDKVAMVKLGLEFFVSNGPSGVKQIAELDVPIFLDLKLHDIPNTVAKTLSVIKNYNVQMVTIHVCGGKEMLEAAANVLFNTKIQLIGVTILTSMNNDNLKEIGMNLPISKQVVVLAELAKKSGLNGIVCSAFEVLEIRRLFGKSFTVICPGIRIDNDSVDDQKRVMTPKEALNCGVDYMVIGRPITSSVDPALVVRNILSNL